MNKKPGFTLVELLIAISLFSVLTGTVFYTLGTQQNIFRRISSGCKTKQINNAVVSRIAADIRAASAILPYSNQNKLALQVGTDAIEFGLSNNKVKRRKNNYSAYLNDEGEIKTLKFSYPGKKLVGISTETFSTEIKLRN